MSTRSVICKEVPVHLYYGVYCHFDGYPEGVGSVLLKHYNTKDKVDELLKLGDLSSLGERIAPNVDEPHDFDNPSDGVCVAYHRDRGEELHPARSIRLPNASGTCGAEYMYVYTMDGTWYFADLNDKNPQLIPLTWEALVNRRN